jgi:uncharacterized membrane protein
MIVDPPSATNRRTLRWVRGVALLLAAFGCWIRFDGLGSKVVWWDETHTGRAIAGSFWGEIIEDVFDGEVHTRDEILVHQFPRDDRSVVDTIYVLVWEDPRQTPLYFVLARAWVKMLGSSEAILRGFSAFLGILGLPLAFLLSRELFGRSLEGWITVGLIAVSPLHFVYAQEARQYILWVDLVILSSWLLLVASRRTRERDRPAWLWWILYTGALGLTLITHLLTVFIMAAHFLFAVISEKFRLSSVVKLTAAALVLVSLLFSRWAWSIFLDSRDRPWVVWAATDVPFWGWLRRVAGSIARTFVDLPDNIVNAGFSSRVLIVFVLLFVLASVAVLIRFAPQRARLFVVLLGLSCWLPMIVVDLSSGGWRAAVSRYHLPTTFALELCAAFAIAYLLSNKQRAIRLGAAVTAAFVLGCGIYSNSFYRQSETWWNKFSGRDLLTTAKLVDRYSSPLVVTSMDDPMGMFTSLAFAHAASDRTGIQIVVEPEMPVIPREYENVFVWRVSDDMLNRLADSGWVLQQLAAPDLYRLKRPKVEGDS